MGQTEAKESPVKMATEESLMLRHKRKLAHLSHTEDHHMPSKELKKMFKSIIKDYSNENLLQPYTARLKKCISDCNPVKLTQFLMDCVSLVVDHSDPKKGNQANKNGGAQKVYPSDDDLVHEKRQQNNILSELSEPGEDEEGRKRKFTANEKKLITKYKIFHTVENTLWKFVELETMKKDNIFFDLSDTFAKLFQAQFENEIKDFATAKRVLGDGKIPYDYIISSKVKERVKSMYEKANIDLKRYQNLQYDMLKAFFTEVSKWTRNDDSLVPSDKALEPMNQKLLFSRSETYHTYFILTRYYSLIEETKLKVCIQKLRHLKPEEFGIEPMLCLDQKTAPYQVIVDSLNYLDTFTNPHDKFHVISKLRGQIMKEIDKYWASSYDQGLITKKLNLTADQLMPLYCYCLVSSLNEKMRAHQLLMEEFIDENSLKFGEQSYYFTTFKAAIDFLVNISQDPLKGLADLNKNKSPKEPKS